MEGFCRACLNTFDNPLELLQYTEERRRLFVYSTGLQVKRNDMFTFQLCKECHLSMKTSCRFKKMCRTSDKKIKSYLALKDVDEGMDFVTFLKRHEDSLTFRLPLLSGGSTPANQRTKDDDNESTCTSIQNFMTDILRADEIPDSEARIIRQVIEEEADVLEDSLDSHWLEDDVSDDEFGLDMSLSRFSTPRSTNHDRMSSPAPREMTSTDITSGEDYDNIPIADTLKKISNSSEPLCPNSYMATKKGVTNETKQNRCVIDKNLEKALKDGNNKEFSLEELLASPVYPSKSGASTPTIKQIIFGDKVKDSKKVKSPKFESDLDILMGSLDKVERSQEILRDVKFGSEPGIGKVSGRKCGLGTKQTMKMEKGKVDLGKVIEGKKIDLGMFSAGKILQQKLDKVKGKLFEEKMELSKSGKLFIGELGKIYKEKLSLDDFDIEKEPEEKSDLENVNDQNQVDGKRNDGNLDLNIEMLLEDRPLGPENVNNAEELDMELFGEPNVEYLEEDSDEGILEEFLNAEKEKLANVEMKKRAVTNLVNAAQINDEELTELLQEAYDTDIELMEGKKMLNSGSAHRNAKVLTKMLSPVENKYCVTNFYCKMCSKKFMNLKALKIHFAKRHKYNFPSLKKQWEAKMKICDICGTTFTNTTKLVHHLRNHNKPNEYSCEKCSLTFKTETARKHHMRTHVSEAMVKPSKNNATNAKYVCKTCGAVSSSASNHLVHERRHSKSYTVRCERCGKGFYRTTELAIHMRQHSGEKPFSCPRCDSAFSRRDGLNRHLKAHMDERMYSCQFCECKFVRSHEVKLHQRTSKTCLSLRQN